jgi:hypothetical protein
LVPDRFLDALAKDKKRTGPHLVLVMMIEGYAFQRVDDLRPDEVEAALREVGARLAELPQVLDGTGRTP